MSWCLICLFTIYFLHQTNHSGELRADFKKEICNATLTILWRHTNHYRLKNQGDSNKSLLWFAETDV